MVDSRIFAVEMKLGIIGAGNMGLSLVEGFLKTKALKPGEIIVSDLDAKKLAQAEKLGVRTTRDNAELAKKSGTILIAVKPYAVEEILASLCGNLKNKLLISIAAGIPTSLIEKSGGRAIRVMPNLCAKDAEMAACYSLGKKATKADEKIARDIFGSLGLFAKVDEKSMAAVTGLSGSGPAFFFLMIKAAADAGEELGLPKSLARSLAAQTAKGAGEMAAKSSEGLEEMIRRVCTPKGTTIEGIKILEKRKAAEAMKGAVKAAAKRARELSR